MMRWIRILAAAGAGVAAALLSSLSASAATLALTPASVGPVGLGTTIALDVVVGGVGGSASLCVGAYDLELTYDPSLVAFVGFAYNPFLGVDPGKVIESSSGGGGVIDLDAVSLLPSSDLVKIQPASFAFGRITLRAVGSGVGLVSFTRSELVDADGVALLPISQLGGSALEIVPEPRVALLLAAGLAALPRARRTRSGSSGPRSVERSRGQIHRARDETVSSVLGRPAPDSLSVSEEKAWGRCDSGPSASSVKKGPVSPSRASASAPTTVTS
jgi:hypothetical protein